MSVLERMRALGPRARVSMGRYLAACAAIGLAGVLVAGCGTQPTSTPTPVVGAAKAAVTATLQPSAPAAIATQAVAAPVATSVPLAATPAATAQAAAAPGTGRAPAGGGMAAAVATPTAKDLAYASLSTAQKLDIYLPAGNGPFPVVVNIHGGGFSGGDKANPAAVDSLLAAGYAVASVNYRLSGEALAPAQIQDIKAAVRWLRANAATYRLDPLKFAAFGQSAGANLAALLGTSCGVAALEGAELGNAGQSSCVQAVIDWFGPTDFLQMDKQFTGTSCPVTHDAANSPESMLLGAAIQTVPEKAKAANPITYVTAKAPAFLIQHGTADCNVPPQQSQLLYDALKPLIGADKVILTFLQGAGHGGSQFTDAANMTIVTDFLAKNLK